MAKPRLILRDLRHPSLAEGSYELNRSPIRIGRGPRCEIRIHSDRIADVQVILRQESNRWTLHPVGPPEGCEFHQGYLTESTGLELGEPFRIGHVELMLAPAFPINENRTGHEVTDNIGRTEADVESPQPVEPLASERPLVGDSVIEEVPMVLLKTSPGEQPIDSEPISDIDPALKNALSPVLQHAPISSSNHNESKAKSVTLAPTLIDAVAFTREESSIRQMRRSEPLRVPATPSLFAAFGEIIAPNSAQPVSPPICKTPGSKNTVKFPITSGTSVAGETFGDIIARQPIRSDRKDVTHHVHGEVLTTFEVLSGSKPRQFKRFVRDHSSSTLFDGAEIKNSPKPSSSIHDLVSQLVDSIPESPVLSIIEDQPNLAFEPESLRIESQNATENDRITEPVEATTFFEASPLDLCTLKRAEKEDPGFDSISTLLDDGSRSSVSTAGTVEFESWLDTVGANLESVETAENPRESWVDMTRQSTDDFEFETSEASEPLCETNGSPDSVPISTAIDDESPDELQEPADSTCFVSEQRFLTVDSLESNLGKVNVHKPQGVRKKLEVNEWPSAQDILRWSADRHGRSILFSTASDCSATNRHGTSTGPQEFMRLNFPTALLLCFVWLAGAGVLVAIGMRMSAQDELTQRSMSALFAAEQSGGSPRLDRESQNRLGEIPSWWEATDDQLWWRSAFMRMREEKGQSSPRSSADMAKVTLARSPLLPAARLWRASQKDGEQNEADYEGLSRDIIPLILTADHHRKLGETAAANQADRIALKLTSNDDPTNLAEETVFDAELGMRRFLIPGQKKILAILKRLVAEPNATEILSEVLPEDRPLVWLTAAQLMRQAGVGDADALADKTIAWQAPAGYSEKQQSLVEAIRAEALAFAGKTGQAIEAYERLTRSVPDSEWKRSLYYNLGELHIRNQKTDAAMLALRKARGVDPNHEVDRHAIAAIRGLSGVMVEKPRTTTSLRTN